MPMTQLEILETVKNDLDLNEETFVDDTDLRKWVKLALKKAEGEIHSIYEDYFLSFTTIPIVSGQNVYDYPTDIYANKIRKIIFKDSAFDVFTVKRVKDLSSATEYELLNPNIANPILEWHTLNTSSGRKIRLFPSSSRDGTLHVWYIRNIAIPATDADEVELDEFEPYIIQYMKTQAYLKDGDPRASDSKVLEDQLLKDMIDNLSDAVPDGENNIQLDTSHYMDSVGSSDDCL